MRARGRAAYERRARLCARGRRRRRRRARCDARECVEAASSGTPTTALRILYSVLSIAIDELAIDELFKFEI